MGNCNNDPTGRLKMFKLIENKFLNTPMNKNLSNSDLAIVRVQHIKK